MKRVPLLVPGHSRDRIIGIAKVRFEKIFKRDFTGCETFVSDLDAVESDEYVEVTR